MSKQMESLNEIDVEDLKAFLLESYEILAQFEQDVLSLENNSLDSDRLNRLYRALHTIKGNCGFLPLPKLEAIAHSGETLLGVIRSAHCAVTPEATTVLLQLTDTIRQILKSIETTASEGQKDHSNLIHKLTNLCDYNSSYTNASSNGSNTVKLTKIDSKILDSESLNLQFLENPETSASTSVKTLDTTIRVQVDLLDQVIDLVGELVLARNRVLQLITTSNDTALNATSQQIDRITNELQDRVMQARMQPISVSWRNLPRLVRDLAIACGKEVTLELEGSETELDRSIVAAIKDPLHHLVRNCIDHGIESPDCRQVRGKPAQGLLKIRAFQESGKVILEISDDGTGIDLTKIKTQAQQFGLISAAQAESLSDREALDLIFAPGFSTATEVTHLSGRGVGLDVVRRNLEAVNGTVEVESQLGYGTTFRLKIPLTLAIIPGLLVSSGGERFIIPQASVQELIRIEGREQIDRSIETLLDVPVYRLRGQILPLVSLASVLQLIESPSQDDVLYFVVISIDGYRFGLIVDHIEDTQDIVVKPLSKQLKTLSMFAGATILGDGTVALILETLGLARYAGVQQQSQIASTTPEVEANDRQLILIILGPQNSRMGIPLTQSTRLEMLPSAQIEQVGQQYLMQYRDRIVSLIDLQSVFTGETCALHEFEEVIPIVVITLNENRTIGLIVQKILDIAEEALTVVGAANRAGSQCYATVQGQITEILDLDAIVDLADPYRTLPKLTSRG